MSSGKQPEVSVGLEEPAPTVNSTTESNSNPRANARMFGKYEIGMKLGEGAFAKVYLAKHVQTGETIALKVFPKDTLNDSDNEEIQREVDVMQSLSHPNIIKLVDVAWNADFGRRKGKPGKAIILAVELASKGELFNFIATHGAFSETVARTYFHQLVEGVSHMHEERIMHRDLKPENLLMDQNFMLKIADFGTSVVLEDEEEEEDYGLLYKEVGTLAYMAPEIFNNQGYNGAAADVWAMGLILFIMVAAFPPMKIAKVQKDWWFRQLYQNKHHRFWKYHHQNAPRKFSPAFEDLINRILLPNPAQRYTLDHIKRHAWYNMPTLTPSQLKTEMGRIMARRDGLLSADSAPAKVPRGFDEETTRDLPPEHPPNFGRLHPVKPPRRYSDNPFASASNPFGSADRISSASAPPAQLVNNAVTCFTSLESDHKLGALWRDLKGAVQDLDRHAQVDEKTYHVTAQVDNMNDNGKITFDVQIFAESKAQDGFVIQLRRGQGSSIEFLCYYHAIRARMHHTLRAVTPPVANPTKVSDL